MIKYRTGGGSALIEQVEVSKETGNSVWLATGQRQSKRSNWTNYFDSFAEAKGYLIDRKRVEIDALNRALDSSHRILQAIQQLESAETWKPCPPSGELQLTEPIDIDVPVKRKEHSL